MISTFRISLDRYRIREIPEAVTKTLNLQDVSEFPALSIAV